MKKKGLCLNGTVHQSMDEEESHLMIETHPSYASHFSYGIQKGNASQFNIGTQNGDESQSGIEIQLINAYRSQCKAEARW